MAGRVETQQVVQPLQCVAVAPLQIVDQEQQRSPALEHRPGQCLEQPLALVSLAHRPRPRQTGSLGQQLGQQTCHLGQPHRFERGQPLAQRGAAQPGDDRRIGQSPLSRVATGGSGNVALAVGPGHQLFGQARLADARLAGQENAARFAAARRAPGRLQRLPFVLASDQAWLALGRARRAALAVAAAFHNRRS